MADKDTLSPEEQPIRLASDRVCAKPKCGCPVVIKGDFCGVHKNEIKQEIASLIDRCDDCTLRVRAFDTLRDWPDFTSAGVLSLAIRICKMIGFDPEKVFGTLLPLWVTGMEEKSKPEKSVLETKICPYCEEEFKSNRRGRHPKVVCGKPECKKLAGRDRGRKKLGLHVFTASRLKFKSTDGKLYDVQGVIDLRFKLKEGKIVKKGDR
jgi:hypothetical protein